MDDPPPLTVQALPALANSSLAGCPDAGVHDVYMAVLAAEELATNEKDRMHARIVGYLIIHFYAFRESLGSQPATRVAHQVHSGPSVEPREVVYRLGLWYREVLLRTCMKPQSTLYADI